MDKQQKEKYYQCCEWVLWKIRYLLLFPVFFLSVALVYLVILMGERMWEATQLIFTTHNAFDVLAFLIDIVDFTLIAVIILLILRGVYELFIRDMPLNDHLQADKVLIHDIDELKQKLGKVIIVSLIVHVFKQALVAHVDTTIDLVWLSVVVLLLAVALFLTEKLGSSSCDKEEETCLHTHCSWKSDWKD